MISNATAIVQLARKFEDKNTGFLTGIQFFDREGEKILDAGDTSYSKNVVDTLLEPNERLVGAEYEAYIVGNVLPKIKNLQFLIAKLP